MEEGPNQLSEQSPSEEIAQLPTFGDTSSAAKGVLTAPENAERDAMGRIVLVDGCIRGESDHFGGFDSQLAAPILTEFSSGSPAEVRNQMDLIYPEEAHIKVLDMWSTSRQISERFDDALIENRTKESICWSLVIGRRTTCFLNIV